VKIQPRWVVTPGKQTKNKQQLFEGTVKYLQNFNTLSNINNPMADIRKIVKLPQSNEHYIQRSTHKQFTICLFLTFTSLLVSASPKREMREMR
jgi:hypothetical protein